MEISTKTVDLGPLENIASGQGRCFLVNDEEIAVFRQRDGRIFAVQNRCPHRQGPLSEGVAGGGNVICPLHSHKFDLCTGAGSEKEECLKVYKVREANGHLLLEF